MNPLQSSAMSDLDYTRLEKLLTMLGSVHDGEVLNAGRLAHKLVSNAGLTWSSLLATRRKPEPPTSRAPEEARPSPPREFRTGQRVTHDRFGSGIILKAKTPWTDRAGRTHNSELLSIDFDKVGRKRVVDFAVVPLD
jgi:hypothetical protein